jgi:glutamate synthase domain-containing protein 1
MRGSPGVSDGGPIQFQLSAASESDMVGVTMFCQFQGVVTRSCATLLTDGIGKMHPPGGLFASPAMIDDQGATTTTSDHLLGTVKGTVRLRRPYAYDMNHVELKVDIVRAQIGDFAQSATGTEQETNDRGVAAAHQVTTGALVQHRLRQIVRHDRDRLFRHDGALVRSMGFRSISSSSTNHPKNVRRDR